MITDNKIVERLDKIEEVLKVHKDKGNVKDGWDKLQAAAAFILPLVIAGLGWYFTNSYNKSSLISKQQADSVQFHIENIKLQVVQAELINDVTVQLTGADKRSKQIALAAIVYSAPGLGKTIADIVAEESPASGTAVEKIYESKIQDLITALYSHDATTRLKAYSEIITSWLNNENFIAELMLQMKQSIELKDPLLDSTNGLFNSFVVLQGISGSRLMVHKDAIIALINKIPSNNKKILQQASQLKRKLLL